MILVIPVDTCYCYAMIVMGIAQTGFDFVLRVTIIVWMEYSIEGIIRSYQLLGGIDSEARERANIHLLTVVDHDEIWTVTQVPPF